jgi:O-antigen ligase
MSAMDSMPPAPARLWAVMASAALALPALLAFNLPPSSTFLNQAAALIGWGSWLTVLAASFTGRGWPGTGGLAALQAAFAVLLLAALAAPLWAGLPWSLALSSAGLILAAALVAQVAAALQQAGLARAAFRAFCIGLVVAGVASSGIGIVEVFAPQWADGDWIARSSLAGRAVGNMRQPNHLSSLLLWAIVGAVWLGEARVLRRGVDTALALLFVFVVVLSGSRTGAVGMAMLAAWGGLDRRLSKRSRALLLLAPVAYAAFWFGVSAWADQAHEVFGGETRFSTKGDISSSRYGIWANTLALIRMHPWFGVGFGEFNFAWTLTPFPGRPVAFFDHTHNLPLQFAVELGLPLAALVTAALAWALAQALMGALRARADADPEQAPLRRAAFMMIFMVCVHSLLEYPLWYAYFLLPAAFAFGLCLGRSAPASAAPALATAGAKSEATRPLLIASMLLMFGGMASVYDYSRVVVIFAPPDGAPALAQRIDEGRNSWFFAHHADYAAATTSEHPAEALGSFRSATHYLLDSRLMIAWAKALNEAGDTDRARHVAQRLREFRNEGADAFFAPCTEPPAPGVAPPFQCQKPEKPYRYEDFR